MKNLALIPARGGSKSIPKKNIVDFLGKPLIAWTIEDALRSKDIDRVIVSTDDDEIAEIAKRYGAEVPFRRPDDLSEDHVTDFPVFEHAINWLRDNENYQPDQILHLRPTSPLRVGEMINKGLELLSSRNDVDSLRSVCIPDNNPYKMWKITQNGMLEQLIDSGITEQYNQPRQNLPATYWQTGVLDIVKLETIRKLRSMTGERILPLVISNESVIDIDDPYCLFKAKLIMEKFGLE